MEDSCKHWQEWFTERTQLPCRVDLLDVPPARFLCFFDETGSELWRIPISVRASPDEAERHLPLALHAGNIALDSRRRLLALLQLSPELLCACAEAIPFVCDAARGAARSAIARDRQLKCPTVFELPAEILRQWQEIIFSVDDLTAERWLQSTVAKS